jgi:nucleoside 2-deoxyribosyltransferase
MKVFFSGSIRGGRQLISTYEHIINFIKSQGHTVLSEHVAMPKLEKVEEKMSEEEIFNKDVGWIEDSDCVMADVTVASVGVGYEVCHALNCGKPVLCVYEVGAKASAMVLGNTSELIQVKGYSGLGEVEGIVREFLEKVDG